MGALARSQSAAGHDVCVITATPGAGTVRSGRDSDGAVTVFRVAAHVPGDLPVHPRAGRRTGQLLRSWQPDVVHVHTGVVSPFAWSALRATAQAMVPRVVTVHSIWGPLAQPGHRLLVSALPWRDDHTVVTAVSSVAAEIVHRQLRVPVGVIPNGIDASLWPLREWQPDPDVLQLVSVLRLAPRKRAVPLIDAIVAATARLSPTKDVVTHIIGDGPARAIVQRRIDHHGMGESIRLTGRLDRRGIQREFAHSDLFVQASVRESFGIAALEARASGVPVIVRSQTGAGEFLTDGLDGILANDDLGITEAIVALASDNVRMAAVQAHAAVPPGCDWEQVHAAAHAAYDQAICGSGGTMK